MYLCVYVQNVYTNLEYSSQTEKEEKNDTDDGRFKEHERTREKSVHK